jgi:oligopeptide transport system ATP-binding protein
MSDANRPFLQIDDLTVHFQVARGPLRRAAVVRAVDGVSLCVARGATLGLVGESGCGKSTLGRAILRLIRPTGGRVTLDGVDLLALEGGRLRRMRRRMQIVFQDPAAAMNPRMNIEAIVGEPLLVHGIARGRAERRRRVAALLERVGLSAEAMGRYPHEFSGGQRQRIVIARALSLDPELLICDEPVASLDVSIQAQILNLLADLRSELGLTYLFIAHDLAVVESFSDQVAVMYLGRIVEQAPAEELYANPRHPYTQALLAAVPRPDPAAASRETAGGAAPPGAAVLEGDPPSPLDPPAGCAFHPRCPFAEARCRTERPGLQARAGMRADHPVACHFAEQTAAFVRH